MIGKLPNLPIVVAGFLAFLPVQLFAQDVCEAFARYGIYDTRSETSDIDKIMSFRTWFCQSKFESKQQANATAISLGYSGFELGHDQSSESWSQFSSNYCRDESFQSKYRETTASYIRTINATASNNMLACFQRGGLHARLIPGARKNSFYIQAIFNPTGKITDARIKTIRVKGATCDKIIRDGTIVNSAGTEQLCQRTGKKSVDVSITATEKVTWDSPRGLAYFAPVAVTQPAPAKPIGVIDFMVLPWERSCSGLGSGWSEEGGDETSHVRFCKRIGIADKYLQAIEELDGPETEKTKCRSKGTEWDWAGHDLPRNKWICKQLREFHIMVASSDGTYLTNFQKSWPSPCDAPLKELYRSRGGVYLCSTPSKLK